MRLVHLVLVFLFVVTLPNIAQASKSMPEVHIGTLVLLVTPDVNAAYTAAIYLGDSNVAIVDQETSDTGLPPEGCSSASCTDFYSLIASMKSNCSPGTDACFQKQSVGYYTRQLTKDRKVYPEVGISLAPGETMWFVPVIESSDQFGRDLWRDHLPTSGIGPRSPDEWQQAISNLTSEKNAAADKVAYQARVASNLAEIAAQKAAQKEEDCLTQLKVGDDRSKVDICGTPDHINSDLYGDQMVYSDGIIVYINKGSNAVENVQWTH